MAADGVGSLAGKTRFRIGALVITTIRAALVLVAALVWLRGWPVAAECLSPEGKVIDLAFLNCVKAGNNYLGSFDRQAIDQLRGRWDVDCVKKTNPTDLIPEDEKNKLLAVRRIGHAYHIYLHYLLDDSYYAWVVSFVDKDTVRTEYKGRMRGGKVEEWVIDGRNTKTGEPVRLLSRCSRVLWCSVTDGASTNMEDDAGSVQPYFSRGDQWPLVLDLAAGTANVPYRQNRAGKMASVNEQYALNTTDTLYTLKSVDSAFGMLNNGLFVVDGITIEVNRQKGAFSKILKILDRNVSQGSYQFFTEAGQCRRAEWSVITPPHQKF